MKKIMIALAVVAMAAGVQAAQVVWKISDMIDYQDKLVYCFNASAQDAVLAALTAGGDELSKVSSANLGGTRSNTGNRAYAGTTALGLGGDQLFWVIFDSTMADGNKYAYTTTQDISAFKYEDGEKSPGTFVFSIKDGANLVAVDQPIGGTGPKPIPEPTSGLLLVLGVAGLALRRKQK